MVTTNVSQQNRLNHVVIRAVNLAATPQVELGFVLTFVFFVLHHAASLGL